MGRLCWAPPASGAPAPTRFLQCYVCPLPVLNPVPPILPKMFRLWVIGLLLPSLALARVLPSSHLNQLRGERVKDPTLDEFVDSDDSFELDKFFEEYSSNDSSESGETEPTTMMPSFPAESEEDQEMRFRYALSQVLLAPPVEEEVNEQPGRSSLKLPPAVQQIKLPPAVQQERALMLLRGENSFQPYANLFEEEELGEEEELEGLEGSVDELPELAAWERYRGPNDLDVEADLEDYEDQQDEEEEDNLEDEEDEGDEGEWQEEEEEGETQEEMNNDENGEEDEEEEDKEEDEQEEDEEDEEEDEEEEEDWLPELSAGAKYRGPIIMMEGQVPK